VFLSREKKHLLGYSCFLPTVYIFVSPLSGSRMMQVSVIVTNVTREVILSASLSFNGVIYKYSV
jgi:hypothetical protein